MTGIPESAWPKPYLIEIYEQALEHGCIRVNLEGDFEKAKSLKAAFYRIRRRSDKQHTDFIKPEYHLVTFSWEEHLGTALFTYNKFPADYGALPKLQQVEHTTAFSPTVARTNKPQDQFTGVPAPQQPGGELNLEDLLADLSSAASKKVDQSGDL